MGKKKPKANGTKPAEKPPGCYVLSLSVENVRCFGTKQTLDCSDGKGRPRQWTVILGDNGSGKTTLLQSVVLHDYTVDTTGTLEELPLSESVLLSRAIAAITTLRAGQSAAQSHLDWATDNWSADAVETTRLTSYRPFMWRQGTLQWWLSKPSTVPTRFFFCGYGANRTSSEPLPPRQPPGASVGTLMGSAIGLSNPVDWLARLDYSAAASASPGQRRMLGRVKRLLIDVLPEVEDITFHAGSGVFPEPNIEFLTPYGWVPLRQLGHGYQTMIAWVVDFVSRMVERYPDSPNPLAEPAVCLVDEIDLHLHPVWQRKVIGYLSERFPNTQFIVTAHSPLVVQAAASADANIAVLERSKEKDADGNYYVEIKNNPEDVKNWRLDQILTSDLFGGLSLNPPKVEELFKEKELLAGLKRPTPAQKARLFEIEAELTKLPVGDDAREVKEMQAIRDALNHLQKRPVK